MKLKLLTVSILMIGALATVVMLKQSKAESPAGQAEKAEVCSYHGIAVSLCTRCNPDLIPEFQAKGDWCPEHKLPESQCDLCHPELGKHGEGDGHAHGEEKHSEGDGHDHGSAKHSEGDGHDHGSEATILGGPVIDWCAEHRVPETQCTKCNPELIAGFKSRNDWCGGHNVPESHCYLCNTGLKFPQETEYEQRSGKSKQSHFPATAPYRKHAADCATDHTVIQLSSIRTPERSGFEFFDVNAAPASEVISAPATVAFDATQASAISCPLSGTLVKWLVAPGEVVRKGQTMAYLESLEAVAQRADFAHAKAMLDLADETMKRKMKLDESGLANSREVQEAKAEYLQARADYDRSLAMLHAIGLTNDEIDGIGNGDDNATTVPLRARQSGRLMAQSAELGAVISAGQTIGLVSQTDQLWVEAFVREQDLERVQLGQRAEISLDDNGRRACGGEVVWISDQIDPASRMGIVRIQAEQGGDVLRGQQYVRAAIEAGGQDDALLVPVGAVQWEGCCNVVFVQESPDRYIPKKVNVVFPSGEYYAVRGLESGARIVSKGSYLLKTELMKSSIGAGCCGTGA